MQHRSPPANCRRPARRAALRDELARLADDGLDPADYPLDSPPAASTSAAQQRACADLQASRSYLLALQHLARGRLPQESIEPFWRAPDSAGPARPSVLSLAWLGLDRPAMAFAAARPGLPQYQALRLRRPASAGAGWPAISKRTPCWWTSPAAC